MSAKTFTFSLPIPPSGNHRNKMAVVRGKPRWFPSPKYEEYISLCLIKLIEQKGKKPIPTTEPVGMTLVVYPKDLKPMDIDNIEKTLNDTLQKIGIIADDKQIRWKAGCYGEVSKQNPRVEVSLTRLSGDRLIDVPAAQAMFNNMVLKLC